MAEWTAAFVNDLPDSAFACIDPGGKKDEDGKTTPRSLRHYPHHDAGGNLDLPHLRAALSRIGSEDNTHCGKSHLMSHRESEGVGKSQLVKATLIDDDHLKLLAFPFHGPIPSPRWPGGVDLDGETFTPRTDIKPDWLPWRPLDWHHGKDGLMAREVIGKADNLHMDEEGWWVDLWLAHGNRRLDLIRRLADKGGRIFGSSEPIAGTQRVNKATGEILVWPYWRQTLSTSPQNTHSRIETAKAALDDAFNGGYPPTDAFWNDLQDALTDLDSDLLNGAKAGRVDPHRLSDVLSDTSVEVERLLALATSRAASGDHDGRGSPDT